MSDPEEQYEDQLGSVFDLDVEFVANEEFEFLTRARSDFPVSAKDRAVQPKCNAPEDGM